jgi:hypothetical protein
MKKALQLLLIAVLASFFFIRDCNIPSIEHEEPADDEVARLIQYMPSSESHPNDSALVILDQEIIEVFPDGSYQDKHRMVIKILAEHGKDHGDISIGFDSRLETLRILRAATTTPDGETIHLRKNAVKIVTPHSSYPEYSDDKELTFSMPGVTVGSIIDYEVLEEGKPIIKGEYSIQPFFQYTCPVIFSRCKITVPKNRELLYRARNVPGLNTPSPLIKEEADKKVYLWEFRNIPRTLDERPYLPPVDEFQFNMLITTHNNWEQFFSWRQGLMKSKTEPNKAIRGKVVELTGGLTSEEEKIEALFDFVKREIRYVSINIKKSGCEPTAAQEVFRNKYGDCKDKSTLLISMLQAAGIPAYYVAIPTRNTGKLIKDIPFPFQFDHAIVAVGQKDGYLFLDPTDETCTFGYLPSMDQDRDILIFKDREVLFAKTPIEEPQASGTFTKQVIRIEQDGSIEVSATYTYAGDVESGERFIYLNSSSLRIKEIFEQKIDNLSVGAQLIEYSHADPLNFKERFYDQFKYHAPDYCKKAGNILTFQIPHIRNSCCASDIKERGFPLDIAESDYRNHTVDITPPQGYKVYYLPDPVEIRCPFFEFRSSYRKDGKNIVCKQEYIQKAIRVSPAEYPDYRRYCKEMERASEKETIFFIKGK